MRINIYFTKMFLIHLVILFHFSYAQCLKIESILVDACNGSTSANPEDFNEMFRFRTGSTPLPISQISIAGAGASGVFQLNKWPNTNKSWWGLVMNANTASLVAALNSSIQACGYIKQPPGGIIPPNSEVILVTSQYMNPALNSFANLNDTIYMIFQDTVNAKGTGHFANWSSTHSYRYFCLIDNSTGCKDTVRYDVAQLPLHTDGDAIEYGPVVSNFKLRDTNYVNRGCQAPFIPLNINISKTGTLVTICKNSSISFTSSTGNTGYSSIQWTSMNGSFSSPNSFTTSFTPNSGFTGNTYVYCTIYKPCGSGFNTAKDSILVKVIESPSITVASTPSNTICTGSSATLAVNITNSANTGTSNIQWQPGNITTPSISTSTSGTYTVNVSNSCGSSSQTINVFVIPTVTISLSASSNTFCTGSSATLTANSNATNYVWSDGSTNTPSIIVNASGNYTVSTSNSCNTSTASVSVAAIDVPTLNIVASSTNVCAGQNFTLTANFNTGNIMWNNGSSSSTLVSNTSGVYSATVSNACGASTQSVNIGVIPTVTISLSASSNTFCTGSSATLTANSNATNYVWSDGSTNTPSIIVNVSGNYTVSTSNSCNTATASVSINAINIPTINISGQANICSGNSSTLIANGASSYTWSTGENTNSIIVTPTSNVTYTVFGNNSSCMSSTVISIVVNNNPTITVSPASATIQPNQSIILNANGGISYSWSPSGGLNNTGISNPIAQPNMSTTYCVWGFNSAGCSDSACARIVIDFNCGELFIPNIFSPNGDNNNDELCVYGTKCILKDYYFVIYDRWGEKVFETTDKQKCWDGQLNGDILNNATFIYYMKGVWNDNTIVEKRGNITLIK